MTLGDQYQAPYAPDASADDVLKSINMRGKLVVVTGGTDGLGRETVRAFAKAGAEVIFTTRNQGRAEEVIDAIKREQPNALVSALFCDLMSMESVERFTAELHIRAPRIDALILNAGVLLPTLQRTSQGLEAHLMTNVVSQFAITEAALPALTAAAPSRLVILTSSAHQASPFLFDDYNMEKTAYDQMLVYAHTKTAAALLALAWNKRLKEKRVLAFAVHPGSIFETGLATHTRQSGDPAEIEKQAALMPLRPGERKTIAQGAATSVWAATDPGLAATGGGRYLENLRTGAVSSDLSLLRDVAPHAVDAAQAERLYTLVQHLARRA